MTPSRVGWFLQADVAVKRKASRILGLAITGLDSILPIVLGSAGVCEALSGKSEKLDFKEQIGDREDQ